MIMMYHASLLMTSLDLLERREGPHTGKKNCIKTPNHTNPTFGTAYSFGFAIE